MSSTSESGFLQRHKSKIIAAIIGLAIVGVALYLLRDKIGLEKMTNPGANNNYTQYNALGNGSNSQYDFYRSMNGDNGGSNKVLDGYDSTRCGISPTSEAYHPHIPSYSGAPKIVGAAAAYSSAYPDETAAQSLAGKTVYSCAPNDAAPNGCDYAINPDSLMPGSWRQGVDCNSGVDPNSQWAKYHPTREKYYRYITAAGSARLGVITRSPIRKILGTQNSLRSCTSTPLTNAQITPFMGSSHQMQAIFDATGAYPTQSLSC